MSTVNNAQRNDLVNALNGNNRVMIIIEQLIRNANGYPSSIPTFSGNNDAITAGLTTGQPYAEVSYPHEVHIAVDAVLISGDNFRICSGDSKILKPYVY